jgi:hypothetical protein
MELCGTWHCLMEQCSTSMADRRTNFSKYMVKQYLGKCCNLSEPIWNSSELKTLSLKEVHGTKRYCEGDLCFKAQTTVSTSMHELVYIDSAVHTYIVNVHRRAYLSPNS